MAVVAVVVGHGRWTDLICQISPLSDTALSSLVNFVRLVKNKSSEDQHRVNMAPPRDQLKLPAKIIEELGGKGMYIANLVPKIK
jgi:hypothetical protein